MILRLNQDIKEEERESIQKLLVRTNVPFRFSVLFGQMAYILYKTPAEQWLKEIEKLAGIAEVNIHDKEYKLSTRAFKPTDTVFNIKGIPVGGSAVNIMAGPCSIESEKQIFTIAEFLSKAGVKFIRGGAYKPRTSPYSFQGMERKGLEWLRSAADTYGLRVVSEVIDSSLIDEIYPYADVLQVGSRNMQNYFFLKQLGKTDKPILLKRGMYSRIDEWLMAAEYILTEGNEQVILCERGIRTFDTTMRNTMDINAIPLLKQLSHLPIIADPSHGTGMRSLVSPIAMASIAAGADGLLIEIHPDADNALSDAMQSLYLPQFTDLISKAEKIAAAVGRSLDTKTDLHQEENLKLCAE